MSISKLPIFLFAENLTGSRYFVFHTQKPRFLAEFTEDEDGTESAWDQDITWIDEPPADAALIAKLMRKAGDFLNDYDKNLGVDCEK